MNVRTCIHVLLMINEVISCNIMSLGSPTHDERMWSLQLLHTYIRDLALLQVAHYLCTLPQQYYAL